MLQKFLQTDIIFGLFFIKNEMRNNLKHVRRPEKRWTIVSMLTEMIIEAVLDYHFSAFLFLSHMITK